MEKKDDDGLNGDQKAQGVWERRTQDRRWGQNQLFGSVRIGTGVQGVSNGDPTDSALAAIASILEKPAGRPIGKPPPPLPEAEKPAPAPIAAGAENFHFAGSETGEVNRAAPDVSPAPVIASPPAPTPAPAPVSPPAPSPTPDDVQVVATRSDTYVKYGPGPLDAIRFKWSTRAAGDGTYFVEETIGINSRAMTSGPMSREDAIEFIDGREADARRRFNALKNEMTGSGASQPPPLPGAGEK
jgi:hypothetical protein